MRGEVVSKIVDRCRHAVTANGTIMEWNYEVWSPTHSARPDGSALLMPQWDLEPPGTLPPSVPIPQPQGSGDRNATPLYDMPSGRVVHHFIPAVTLRSSALRSLGAYANIFAIESFMDELATSVGADPVDYRLHHLKDPRGAEVIKTAADRFGWSNYAAEPGRGRGFGRNFPPQARGRRSMASPSIQPAIVPAGARCARPR
jgi:nicotinate dehydrogenase subunit B